MQVVAVEGINNYNGLLIPSKIYDEVIFWWILTVLFLLFFGTWKFAGYCTTSTIEKGQVRDRYMHAW